MKRKFGIRCWIRIQNLLSDLNSVFVVETGYGYSIRCRIRIFNLLSDPDSEIIARYGFGIDCCMRIRLDASHQNIWQQFLNPDLTINSESGSDNKLIAVSGSGLIPLIKTTSSNKLTDTQFEITHWLERYLVEAAIRKKVKLILTYR